VVLVVACAGVDAARNRLPLVTGARATAGWLAVMVAGALEGWMGHVVLMVACAEVDAARNRLPSVTGARATAGWLAMLVAGALEG